MPDSSLGILLPRRKDESYTTFVERLAKAQREFSTRDLVAVKDASGVLRPITPTEAEKAVARLRSKDWGITTTEEDHAGWRTYRIVHGPPDKKKQDVPEPEKPTADPKRWYCKVCEGHPTAAPTVLLAGIAEGRCSDCRKKRMFVQR